MLKDNPKFTSKLIGAHREPCHRVRECNGQHEITAERFDFTIDDNDSVLGTVSERYSLVQNTEFVSALDIAADRHSLKIEPIRAEYVNGRSFYRFECPELQMTIKGDSSPTNGIIELRNDYKGQGGLNILSGWYRLVCTNGMIVGEIASKNTRRHVGDINILEFVEPAVEAMVAQFEVEHLIAQSLAAHQIDVELGVSYFLGRRKEAQAQTGNDVTLYTRMLADTADRYHADLDSTIQRYQTLVGHNLWAIAQAVAEIATHRMQQTQAGTLRTSFNSAADLWASKQLRTIRAELVEA